MEPFLGQIQLFGFNFAPRGWAFCNGQLLSISQNNALFALLGTIYGGDGRTTFALPDLQGRTVVGFGQGPGLSNYRIGQKGGQEIVTLNVNEIPSHTHLTTTTVGTGVPPSSSEIISLQGAASKIDSHAVVVNGATGGSQGHNNIQPYCALNYAIALQGIFPSRN